MHYTNLALTLLAAGATAPVIEAAFVPKHGQRATTIERDFFPANRFVTPPQKERDVPSENLKKRHTKSSSHKRRARHVIKKKRSGTCAVKTSSSSAEVSGYANATSAIGGNNLVSPSATGVTGTASSAATSTTAWWTAPSSSAAGVSTSEYANATATAPISDAASASTSASATAASSAAASPSSSSSSPWSLVDTYAGSTFFDNWLFWNYDDPTHGTVEYVSESDAWSNNLVEINTAGNAIMRVETTQQVSNGRKSVRLHGNRVFTGGLVLMDALHMPSGCGTWPAWWSNGPNWPNGGEIDILESVNAFTENQVSLHTSDGCTMPSWTAESMSGQFTTGNFDSLNCASYATSNQGCGIRAVNQDTTTGAGFNSVNGGVYALKWDKTGITAWFFPRSSIPADITADAPEPANWGTPMANFPSDSCNPYEFFYDHFNIFDTTFCGDWAGADAVWNYAGYAGQTESCAAITGYSSCSDYVLNSGSSFTDAYWEVQYVKYFNSTTEL